MGGEPLDDGSFPTNKQSKVKYADIFEEQCPFYMSIGMTPEQYWDGDVRLVRYFRKAYELHKRQKNQELWMQGLYFNAALSTSLNNLFSKNKIEYPSEPFALDKAEAESKKEKEAEIKMQKTIAAFKVRAAMINKEIIAKTTEGKNE